MSENSIANNNFDASRNVVMPPSCPNGQSYTVKPGDTMFFIARRYNISLQSLINANPQIADPNTIYPGQVICIPTAAPSLGVLCPGGQIYRVTSGDTMFEIAKRFGITLDALIQANPQVVNPDLIYPDQDICVPLPVGPIPCPGGTSYVVKTGDTMFEIARMNNIPLTTLIMANPQISDPNLIFPGQVICIPTPVMEIPAIPMPEVPVPMPMPVAPPAMMPLPPVTSPISICPTVPSTPPAMPCPTAPGGFTQPMMPPAMPCPTAPGRVTQPMMPPVMPCPTAPGRITQPMMPPAMPYPQVPGPVTQPMPVYIVIPWEECPFRTKKKKRERHHKCCR